ncbi:MAG TPA: hypothetical protein VII01_09530 [Solirubrobacteraceae bacterium]
MARCTGRLGRRSALAALAALLPAALAFAIPHGGSASGRGPVITPTAARLVLAAVWGKRELARTSDDADAIKALDTSPELARDMSVTIEARDRGGWSQRVQRPLERSVVLVPQQMRFPASFLAVVQTTSQWSASPVSHTPAGLATALLVFTRASRSATWRVAMETNYHGTIEQTSVGLDLGAFAAPATFSAPASQPAWTSPARAIRELAAFYEHYAEDGVAPPHSPFLPSYWTTGQGEQIAAVGLNGQVSPRGFRNHVTYTTDLAADGLYQFGLGAMNLTCGTVRGREIAKPAEAGGYLNQPADRANWGGWLAPGAYSRITSALMHQVCLVIAPTSFGGIQAISGDDEDDDLNVVGALLFRYPPDSPPGQAQ